MFRHCSDASANILKDFAFVGSTGPDVPLEPPMWFPAEGMTIELLPVGYSGATDLNAPKPIEIGADPSTT